MNDFMPSDVVIVRFKGIKQMNPHFDLDKMWNGGGYDQPELSFSLFSKTDLLGTIYLTDLSCGDFGDLFYISAVDLENNQYDIAAWGSMLGSEYPAPQSWSGILYAVTQLVNNHVGTPWFNIPVQSN